MLKKIIILEGIDGAGKSTAADFLIEMFNYSGLKTFLIKSSDCVLKVGGKEISLREVANEEDINNRFKADIINAILSDVARRAIESTEYDIVIFDRFLSSTIAYQLACNDNSVKSEMLISAYAIFNGHDVSTLLLVSDNLSFRERLELRGENDNIEKAIISIEEFYDDILRSYDWCMHKIKSETYGRVFCIENNGTIEELKRKIAIDFLLK